MFEGLQHDSWHLVRCSRCAACSTNREGPNLKLRCTRQARAKVASDEGTRSGPRKAGLGRREEGACWEATHEWTGADETNKKKCESIGKEDSVKVKRQGLLSKPCSCIRDVRRGEPMRREKARLLGWSLGTLEKAGWCRLLA